MKPFLFVAFLSVLAVISSAQSISISAKPDSGPDAPGVRMLSVPKWVRIGGNIPAGVTMRDEKQFFFSNSFYNQFVVDHNGIRIVALSLFELKRGDKQRRVVDAVIVTTRGVMVDGVRIGAPLDQLVKVVPRDSIVSCGGFGHFVELPSGWIAVLFEGESLGEPLLDSTPVYAFALGGRNSILPRTKLK